jgi:hypothetical protein
VSDNQKGDTEATMKSTFPDCQVAEGHKVHLDKWPTRIAPLYSSPAQCEGVLAEQAERPEALKAICAELMSPIAQV